MGLPGFGVADPLVFIPRELLCGGEDFGGKGSWDDGAKEFRWCGLPHRAYPLGAVVLDRGGRLNGALDEESTAISPLCGAGDLPALPEQVEFFVADEAKSWPFLPAAWGEFGSETQPSEGAGHPLMDASVAVGGGEFIPRCAGRNGQAVGPVPVVGNQTASGAATHEGS